MIGGKNTALQSYLNSGLQRGFQGQEYEVVESNQQNSQREYDITLSDKDNPLIYSDDIGNMNYLEKQYAAYQEKMNPDNDNY